MFLLVKWGKKVSLLWFYTCQYLIKHISFVVVIVKTGNATQHK